MGCQFVKPSGEQCKAKALDNDEFCFFHSKNEEVVQSRKQAASKGGRSNKKVEYMQGPIKINSTSEIIDLYEKTVNDLRTGKIDIRRANSIAYICNSMLKAFEQRDILAKLQTLETVLNVRGG
ncbi:MAG: hypothetical protein COS47_00185 [Candidatus Nealsonbacteria bacterium CG03_land_8_20_14_0_80_36_12]|uniref:Uncharacterized protein n=1 Tax=Candidatus Nealsonbacteria bacterium CG03_land_8_20_14_0_80_36_12 TaxID=1974701 RepID=A0A2M7BYW0_9BACT|nr:MAG: hypothetical protein COS47_00185 [Candidatus Nealsonbacteria bacterium CG03_land_8_20_14_0_80_36_12]